MKISPSRLLLIYCLVIWHCIVRPIPFFLRYIHRQYNSTASLHYEDELNLRYHLKIGTGTPKEPVTSQIEFNFA